MPGPSDDVSITLSGNPTIQITTGSQSVNSLTSTDPISISGGSLSVAANSTISGGLAMTGGSLTASGSGVVFTVTGTTTDSGGSLYAEGGASLSLAQLTGYTGNGSTTTLEATGTGSTLTLANLASVTEAANNYQAQTQFEALAGGTVTLSALKTINTGTVVLESDGTSSVLERLGPDRLHRGQRLDHLHPPGLQRRHGRRRQPGQPVQREPEHRRPGGGPHARLA